MMALHMVVQGEGQSSALLFGSASAAREAGRLLAGT